MNRKRYLLLYRYGTSWGSEIISQNHTLAESGCNGVAVHRFELLRPKEYTFRGQVELAAEPFQEEQKDSEEHLRKVWIFPLCLLDDNSEIEKQNYKTIWGRLKRLVTNQLEKQKKIL